MEQLAELCAPGGLEALDRLRGRVNLRELQMNFDSESNEAIRNPSAYNKALIEYAGALALSTSQAELELAVDLLRGLDSESGCFYCALALFQLGRYREARLCCEDILMRKCATSSASVELAARDLLERIRNQVTLNGWRGIGVIASVTVLASLAGWWLASGTAKREGED
ncbi:hypothetical protein BASA81_004464 [Batrachochytrium salamandrivorans]|nr:hypothetical protein BASA81_004464 [Batrachochytrium salamandrivorans]